MSTVRSSGDSTIDRLIDVAGGIFAAKGPSATVREICSAAGCSVAAINYHFGDKQRLYVRCVQAACEHKQRLFPLPTLQDSPNLPDLLRQFLRTIASRMTAKSNLSWHNTLMMKEVISPSTGVAEILAPTFQHDFATLSQLIGKLLGSALDSDAMRSSFTTQIVARSMFLRTGKNLRSIVGIDSSINEDPQQYADHVCDSILTQIDNLRRGQRLPLLDWSATNNDSATQTPLES